MNLKIIYNRLKAERIAFISLIYFVVLAFVAIFGSSIYPHNSQDQDLMNVLAMPSFEHWMGKDELGRDIFARVIYGSRTAFQAGIVAIIIPLFVGVPFGIVSGYLGGLIDDIFMRIVDAVTSIPAILLALGITAALGVNLWNAMIAIGIVFTPQFARLARGQTLQIRSEPYVEASKIFGAGTFWILVKHIAPNIAPTIVVQASFNLSLAILVEASVSFLGMGAQDPQVSWGIMINQAYNLINVNPWMMMYPGFAIILTVLAGNFLGDGLSVALDPKHK